MKSKLETAVMENVTSQVRPLSSEWLISFKDPRVLWEEHWFALVLEILGASLLFQVYRHAKRSNPQSAYLLLTAVTATFGFEMLQVVPLPGYQLWWYHQGAVNFLKQRVPSYVITLYALVHYLAHSLTTHSNLPVITRSLVTSVTAVLIYAPCLWLAPRLLLVLLHFDDPVFHDQLFDIPYIQLLVLTLLFFHTSHLFHQKYAEIEAEDRTVANQIRCSIQTGLASAAYTIVEQYLLYILLTLTLKLNAAACLISALTIMAVLAKDELKATEITAYNFAGLLKPLKRKEWWFLLGTFILTSTLPLWLNVENLKSSGERLELGPCNISHDVSNTSPMEIPRSRYVCPNDTYRLDFDFHCVEKEDVIFGVQRNTSRYTICGTSFQNPVQVTKVIAIYSVACICLFHIGMLVSFIFKNECKRDAVNSKKIQ